MHLIPAIKKDAELIAEMDSKLKDKDHFYVWWLGQSGFLVQWNGKRLLIDPYLSDSLTTKYAKTDKPHIRMSERVVRPELLKNISVVSSSHNHTDHLDAETLVPILINNPGIHFVIPEANRDFVANRLSCDRAFPVGLNDAESIRAGEFTFHGIPAKHNEIERDNEGRCKFMGYVIEFGRWKIYHSGDTLWFENIVALVRPFKVDLALLPINGDDPRRQVAGNLSFREAAQLAKEIDARCVIPCHYDLFSFNTADVNDFVREAQNIDQPFQILKGGEFYSSST